MQFDVRFSEPESEGEIERERGIKREKDFHFLSSEHLRYIPVWVYMYVYIDAS